MNIEQVVIDLASKSFRKDISLITPETNIRKDLSEKSILMLAFISAIEGELDVSIPLSQANTLDTIQDFIDVIKANI